MLRKSGSMKKEALSSRKEVLMATRPESASKKSPTLLEVVGILSLISFSVSAGVSYLYSHGTQITILVSND